MVCGDPLRGFPVRDHAELEAELRHDDVLQVLAEFFLPPYSPELSPIEQFFSKLEAHLRRIGVRTYDDLIDAIGDVRDLFDPSECWNFFAAAGYAEDQKENDLGQRSSARLLDQPFCRKLHRDLGSFPDFAAQAQTSTMQLSQSFGQWQAQTGALMLSTASACRLQKWLHHLLQFFGGDANAGIRDYNVQRSSLGMTHINCHPPTGRGKFYGVR